MLIHLTQRLTLTNTFFVLGTFRVRPSEKSPCILIIAWSLSLSFLFSWCPHHNWSSFQIFPSSLSPDKYADEQIFQEVVKSCQNRDLCLQVQVGRLVSSISFSSFPSYSSLSSFSSSSPLLPPSNSLPPILIQRTIGILVGIGIQQLDVESPYL